MVKHLQLKLMLLLCALVAGSGTMWGQSITTSSLAWPTPQLSENFNNLLDVSGTAASSASNLTAYGIFNKLYNNSTSNLYKIETNETYASKVLSLNSGSNSPLIASITGETFATTGAFSFKTLKTDKCMVGLYKEDGNGAYAKASSSVYIQNTLGALSINDGSGWVSIGSYTTNVIEVCVIYNNTTSSTTYGDNISLGAKKAHVFVNGSCVMNGSTPKNFTIPGALLTVFRALPQASSGNKATIDDVNIYNSLPTAVPTGPVDVTLSFTNSTPSISLTKGDGTFDGSFEPELSASPANYNGTISYSIDVSNSTIPSGWLVEVNSEGEVTIVADTNEGATIKVKASGTAVTDKFNKPADATYTLTVNPYKPAAPTFSVAAGAVDYGTSLTLTAAEGTTIRYTLDEYNPTASTGEVYSTPIAIKNNGTVKAIAIDGSFVSDIASAAYTINTPANVTVTPAGVSRPNYQEVQYGTLITMSHPLKDAGLGTIYYTTNASVPSTQMGNDPTKVYTYTEPIAIVESNTKIKAQFRTDNGVFWSASAPDNYYTVATPDVPTASEASGEVAINTIVTLSHALLENSLGKIYYTVTTDGTEPAEPTAESTEYTNGITIDADKKIKARFITNGGHLGEIATFEYTYTRTAAGLEYATSSYEVPVNSSFDTPELTNPHGLTITYTSTNTDIAEVNAQTGAITIKAVEGTTTIYARSERDATYYAGEASYTITVYDPTIKGTKWNPFTVAEALELIAGLTSGTITTETYYVNGLVSTTGTPSSNKLTYRISDDGNSTDGQELNIWQGKYIDNANFNSSNNLQVGDEVIVVGTLEHYSSGTPYVNDSYLTYFKRRAAAGFSFSSASVTLQLEETFTAPTFNNPNSLTNITFNSDNTDVATVDAQTGAITCNVNVLGTAVITATSPQTDEYNTGSSTFTINVERKDATLNVSDDITSMDVTTEMEVNTLYTTNSDGTVTLTSSAPEVAAIEDGKLKALAPGTATITVSVAQSETYKGTSNTFTVTVTSKDAVQPASPASNGFTLVTDASTLSAGDQVIIVSSKSNGTGNAMSTTQNENNRGITEVTISGEAIASVSNLVQILTLEGDATNGWYFNTGSGYLYAASSNKNYLRTETTADANAKATISISNGAATITFKGTNTHNLLQYNNSNSIFSCYLSGQDDVYLYRLNTASTYDITTNASGWKTLVSSVNVSLPAGLKAYKVTDVTASSVTLEEISAVKKNVPVIINGAANTEYTLTIVADDDSSLDDNSDNLLQISTNTTGNGVYVLATKNGNTGWYKWAGGSLGAGRVYLPASEIPSNAREFLSFDYDATGISNIDANLNLDGRVYDLQGRRVAQPQKGGLYIVNGRKVVVK